MQFMRAEIKTEGGWIGTQFVTVHDDGTRELTEVVLKRTPEGKRCTLIFSAKPDLSYYVYSLANLVPYGEWEMVGKEVAQ